MTRRFFRNLREIGKRLTVRYCIIAVLLTSYPNPLIFSARASDSSANINQTPPPERASEAPIKVNRTVPKVQPPKSGLDFSAQPTLQEIFRARVFAEPLVPIGGDPSPAENAALVKALIGYAKRSGPDDFSSITGFLETHPDSVWQAALLTDLGLEYYNTGHYSLALDAWERAWPLANGATDLKGKAMADLAVAELAYMYGRLGRMTELESLLKSVEGRVFSGPATEKISGARSGLSEMNEHPETSFRCGPLALHRILKWLERDKGKTEVVAASASTQKGFSLPQVFALSAKLGLNYQMAYRQIGSELIVPAVVHWKVGHYAAIIREQNGRYLLHDPTFRNDAWITKEALENETTGYFLVPPGELAPGWRSVAAAEGDAVWGKGDVGGPDPGGGGGGPGPRPCKGMAISSVDMLFVSLSLTDEPVGYSPPVGPAVRLMVHYNQRDLFQPANFSYSNFGPKWTFGWLAYITDDPTNPNADAQYYRRGGFSRFFKGYNPTTKSYAYQLYDQTKLTRTSPTSYEMLERDGSKQIFGQSDGSAGASRKVFLTKIVDPYGNALTLTYDINMRMVAITDAIGQVTTLSYDKADDIYKITAVADPFGRTARFDYDVSGRLTKITDVIGITSEFTYDGPGDFVNSLITPYGTNTFIRAEKGPIRSLETLYADGERERVEFNPSPGLGTPDADPADTVPVGMATLNRYLYYRNTYYWGKIACAMAYTNYTKAKIYHWLHTEDLNPRSAAGILESSKEPLENRVWYDYAGQATPIETGKSSNPSHIGRVLDDGSTQLHSYEYNDFGRLTRRVDPVGRTFSSIYAINGIDLIESRQTRDGQSELLSKMTYNAQHLPLTVTDSSAQMTSYTYNSRGQVTTTVNIRDELVTYLYDANGYFLMKTGPLPGLSVRFTYDAIGNVRTRSDESGYMMTFAYDSLDRLATITFPDGTFEYSSYTLLDQTLTRDRAGRETRRKKLDSEMVCP